MLRKIFLISVLVAAGFSLFAGEHDLKGRDIAERGEKVELSGIFKVDDNELYLVTDSKELIIHLGPQWYSDEIGFSGKDWVEGTVKGFFYEQEISPITIQVDGKIYSFRDEDGLPAWRGRGERMGHGKRFNSHGSIGKP